MMITFLALTLMSLGSSGGPSVPPEASVVRVVVLEVTDEVEHFYARFSEPMPLLLVGDSAVTPCELCVSGAPNAVYAGARYREKRLPIDRWGEFRTVLQSDLFARLVEEESGEFPVLEDLESVLTVNLQPYMYGDRVNSSIAYEDCPEAGAILRLSNAAVDSDRSRALVYAELTMVHSVDMRFYLLSRDADGEWTVEWIAPVLFYPE